MADNVRVKGYRELVRAATRADKDTRKYMRDTFRQTGDIVKVDATGKFESYDAKSAAGFRTRVRQRGVEVEQSIKRSTIEQRRRPKFGALQMERALEPSLDENRARVEREFEKAIDKVCDRFENLP